MDRLRRLYFTFFAALCLGLATQSIAAPKPAAGHLNRPALLNSYPDYRVDLEVAYTGTGKLSYQWYRDGRLLRGMTAKRLPLVSPSLAQRGAYVVEITDTADGAIARQIFFVNVVLPRRHLLAFGDNSHGQTNIPAALRPPATIEAIAAGGGHNLAISSGFIHAWGNNEAGQCEVPALNGTRAYAVAAGATHSMALLEDARVIAWGDNASAQCDVPASLGPVRAIGAGGGHSLAVQFDGQVVGWGDNSSGQTSIPAFSSTVIAIAAGHDHSLVLLENGQVIAWGANDRGQCEVPPGLRNIVSIGAAGDASFAVTKAGRVHVWGDTSFGQTPAPTKLKPVASAAGGWDFIAARLSSGGLSFWGDGATDLAAESKGLGKIYALAAGGGHVLALRNGATDAKPRIVVRPAEKTSTTWDQPVELSVTAKGPLLAYQWYHNHQPIAGANQATYRIDAMRLKDVGAYFVRVFNGSNYVDIAPVGVSRPDMPPLEFSLATDIRQVRQVGERLRIEVNGSGAGAVRYTWLQNGKVLSGKTGAVLDLPVEGEAAAGVYEVEARDEGDQFKTLPTFVVVPPVQPTQLVAWGERMLGQTAIPEGLHDVIDVTAGKSHSLALRANGTVAAWGDNRFGQCNIPAGLADVVSIAAGEYYSAALRAGGTIVAWGGGKAPVTLHTNNPQLTAIHLLPTGVFATERFNPSYSMGSGTTGSGELTYEILPNGNVWGRATNYHPPLLPLPKPAAPVAASFTAKSVVSTGVTQVGGISVFDYPPSPNERSAVYGNYGQQVRAFSHYHGRSATILADHSLRFWGTGSYMETTAWSGPRPSYWASYAINADGRIDNASSVLAGGTFYIWQRVGGGIGGIGSQEAFRDMPERLTGLKFWRAGDSHVVAVLASEAPAAPDIVAFSAGRSVAPGETARLRVRAEGRHLRYQWLFNNEPIAGATGTSWDVTAFAPEKAGAYRVRVTDGFTSVLSQTCELSLGTAPTLAQAPKPRVGLRAGERLELSATVPAGSNYRFEWRRNGILLESETTASLVREAAILTDAGRYTFRAIDAAGAMVQATSHVFVLPQAGTRIVHERDLNASNAHSKPWRILEDAIDFLPSGLALRIDGKVSIWGERAGSVYDAEWCASQSDIVAISDWALLRADGTLAVPPRETGIPAAALALNNVIALVSNPRAIVLDDGRVGLLKAKGGSATTSWPISYDLHWLGGVGDLVEARSINVNTEPEVVYNGFPSSLSQILIAIGADGSVVYNGAPTPAVFPKLTDARRALPDRKGGASLISSTGEVVGATRFGISQEADPSLAELLNADANLETRVELLAGGRVRAWSLKRTGGEVSATERLATTMWQRDNLLVRLDGGAVMTLRSAESLPVVAFASSRQVFEFGQAVVLEAIAESGSGELSFEWERNGGRLQNAGASRLELPAGDPNSAGWYRVRVTDADGGFAEAVIYVQIKASGAKLIVIPATPSVVAPAVDDLVDMAPGIGIRADGKVTMWNISTGETQGVVPDSVQDVVAVTAQGVALDSKGMLTVWNPTSGEIVRRTEGVLWLRGGPTLEHAGFAIMRDGSARSITTNSEIGIPHTWQTEIVDILGGQRRQWMDAVHFLLGRDGSAVRSDGYNLITARKASDEVMDIRVDGGIGQLLVKKSDGYAYLVGQGSHSRTEMRVFDRNRSSELGITAAGTLSSGGVEGKVLRLWSPWVLVAPSP